MSGDVVTRRDEFDETLRRVCTRRLDHAGFPTLYFDASYVKTHVGGDVVFEAIVMATGLRGDGETEPLGVAVGDSESTEFWEQFLHSLLTRGLHGVEVVESNEHGGLQAAIERILPSARWRTSGVLDLTLAEEEEAASHPDGT